MRYHYSPIRMVYIKKSDYSKCFALEFQILLCIQFHPFCPALSNLHFPSQSVGAICLISFSSIISGRVECTPVMYSDS